jgi:hypothetical protein
MERVVVRPNSVARKRANLRFAPTDYH